jgi:TolB protein
LSRIFGAATAIVMLMLGHAAVASTNQRHGVIIYTAVSSCEGIFAANTDGSGARDLTHSGTACDGYPSVSPDGTRIAFDHTGDNESSIVVMNADGSGRQTITPDIASFPEWSPDGTLIALADIDHNSIYVVHPDGSGLRRVVTNAPQYGIAWSPDSRVIAYGGSAGLTTVDVSSGAHKVLAPLPGSWRPAWSPDGAQIAFDDNDGNVRVVAPDGSNLRNTHVQTGAETPSWSSDGTRLVVGRSYRVLAHA